MRQNIDMEKVYFVLTLICSSLAWGKSWPLCPSLCRCNRGMNRLSCTNTGLTESYLSTLVVPLSVREVHLTNNGLKGISKISMLSFRHIVKLVISKNPMSHIPVGTFDGFSNLTTLKMNKNKLRHLEPGSFRGLCKVTVLELQGNDLVTLQPHVFDELISLSYLKLDNNNINEVPDNVFPALRMLRVLFLGHNKIHKLGESAFHNMTMNRVGLAHNRIRDLVRSTFHGFKIKFSVLLYFNPMECDCERTMRYATYFSDMQNDIWASCASPPQLKGKSILTAYTNTECTKCDLKLCQNGGSCQGNKSFFNCTCSEQFKGDNCEHSICTPEIKYVTKYVQEPVTKVQKYSDIAGATDEIDAVKKWDKKIENIKHNTSLTMEKKKNELETKLLILYAICSLELVIILCFVGLLILGKYQDWRLMQKYNKAKSPHVLEKFQTSMTNEHPANGKGYISISELIPYKY